MFLTTVLQAKAKTKNVLVMCLSVASGHAKNVVRERKGEKVEFVSFDPLINAESLYVESKKLCSVSIICKNQKQAPSNLLIDII